MAKSRSRRADRRRFQAARARGVTLLRDAAKLVDASYDIPGEAVVLSFQGGGSMTIPRRVIPGLERQPASALKAITLSHAGDALRWPSIDADVYLPGLIQRAFGSRLFAAAARRRGGRRPTKAKAAARQNGARSGRPKRRVSG